MLIHKNYNSRRKLARLAICLKLRAHAWLREWWRHILAALFVEVIKILLLHLLIQ